MLDQDREEALQRSQDSSVHDDWSTEAWLQFVLLPNEVLVVHVVLFENLRSELLLLMFLIVNFSLLLGSGFRLVLQVESDWVLEIELNRAALMLSSQSVVHFDIDLGSIERAITVVVSPWVTKFVKRSSESIFSGIPLLLSS